MAFQKNKSLFDSHLSFIVGHNHVRKTVQLFRTTLLSFLSMEHFRLGVPEFGICISWKIAVMLHLFDLKVKRKVKLEPSATDWKLIFL